MDGRDTQPLQPRRLHPLIAAAAGAVIVASLAGTAAVTGLFSKASGTDAQTGHTQAAQVVAQQQVQPPVVDSAAPVNGAAAQQPLAGQPQQVQQAAQQKASTRPSADTATATARPAARASRTAVRATAGT
jgi:hypothetical protein